MLRRMRRRDVLRAARAALGAAAIASPALAQLGTAMPSFDRTPDKPQSFGYKVLWFAVRASDPASVLDALEFGPGTQANWASGLSAAYDYGTEWAFVSPPVDGWVFVVGGSLPQPFALNPPLFKGQHEIGRRFDVLLSRLMKKFDDVQYFGTHRVVSLGAWARALNGKPVRIFAFACGGTAECQVYANVGDQTSEEAQLKFANLTGLSPSDARDRILKISQEEDAEEMALVARGLSPPEARARVRKNSRAYPDEQEVFDLAALWSIDPTKLSVQDHPPGLGLATPLPKNMSQRVEIDR